MTSRTVSRISWKSITDTFGNRSTRSCWNRARAWTSRRALERRDEGLRRLVERAGPEHEHEAAVARIAPVDFADAGDPRADDAAEDVEPHRVADVDAANRSCRPLLDRHFGFRATARSRTRRRRPVSFDFEVVAVGDGVLAASEPRARTSSKLSSFVSRPRTPVTRARSTGISWDWPAPCAGSARNARTPSAWSRWMSMQEHVGRVLRRPASRTPRAGSPAATGRRR